jgi:hypothetical protein
MRLVALSELRSQSLDGRRPVVTPGKGHLRRVSYVRAFLALDYELLSVITTLALGLLLSGVKRNLCVTGNFLPFLP